jgi:hypothetical protein
VAGKKKQDYRDLAESIRVYGWPSDNVLAIRLGCPITAKTIADLDYGLWLNRQRAVSCDVGSGTFRAIRAALSKTPDALLLEATFDVTGKRLEQLIADAQLAAMEAEAIARR